MRRALVVLVATLVALLSSSIASADPRTAYLVEQLKTNEDYRVRTQAALALGASGDDAAVQPLCDALGADSNVSVRTAAAAAMGKLAKQTALPCLKTAEGKEGAPSVKSQIQKSIATISGGGGAAAPIPADAKYYVAIQITNKTGRPAAEIDRIVRGALQAKLLGKKGYAVAPAGESPAKGGEVVRSKNLKGFLLLTVVEPPKYEGGGLTQVLRVSMFTYPDRSLLGELAPKLTQSDTQQGDKESENLLMKMCGENAADSFTKIAASL